MTTHIRGSPTRRIFIGAILITFLLLCHPQFVWAALPPQSFTDSDGDVYTVKLIGPGTAVVKLDDPDGDTRGPIASISLHGTDTTSSLLIAVTRIGDGRVTIGRISSTNSLGGIVAPQCDLGAGGIQLAGLRSLRIGDVAAGSAILLPAAQDARTLSVTARNVGAMQLTAPSSTLTLTAQSVTGGAKFSANKIAAFKVTDGDCAADIATPRKFVSLSVKGGNFAGHIVAYMIGTISVTTDRTGRGGGIANGTITAGSIGTLLVDRDLSNSLILAGANLGADGALGGTGADADTFAAGRLGTVIIRGNMVNSIIGAGITPVDGKFKDSTDSTVGGALSPLTAFTVKGQIDNQSIVGAGRLPQFVSVNLARIKPRDDSHFISRAFSPNEPVTLITSADATIGYATIQLARAAAVSGDTIMVGPGIHIITSNLALPGGTLNYFLSPSATLNLDITNVQMFDDEGAATTLNVTGFGSATLATDSAGSIVKMTHAGSVFSVTLRSILFTNRGANEAFVVNQQDGTWLGTIDEILVTGLGGTPTVLYWRKGPHITRCQRIVSSSGYLVWAEPTGTLRSDVSGEMIVDCPYLSGGADGLPTIYAGDGGGGGGANPFAAIWVNATRVINPVPGRPSFGHGLAAFCAGPKLYIQGGPKITGSIGVSSGILYVDAEKQDLATFDVTESHPTDTMIALFGGQSHISIGEVVDTNLDPGGATIVSSGGDHRVNIVNHVRTVLGNGISHSAGNLRFTGEMNASVGASNPIFVSGSGLILGSGTVLIAGAGRDSITADSPQDVAAYGAWANRAVNANITITTTGGLTIDPDVR